MQDLDNVNIEAENEEPSAKPKKKLTKGKKILIVIGSIAGALVLGFIILCVILMMDSGSGSSSSEPLTEKTTTIYEVEFELENGEDEFVQANADFTPVKLKEKSLAGFESYLNDFEVNYDYGDVYGVDEALGRLAQEKPAVTKHAHDVRVGGKLDANELYKIAKKNNEAFVAEGKMGYQEEYSNKDLKRYCNLLVDALNDIHENRPDLDFDSVCCYLYDVKIMPAGFSLDFAALNPSNKVFHVNEDSTKNYGELTHNANMFTQTMYHEAMHFYQVACSCNELNETRIGISHEYEGLEINPLRWFWLAESSAEMNSAEFLGLDPVTYQAKISYNDSLDFLLNLNGTNETAALDKMSFTHDTNRLFEMFDVTDEAQKKEFIKMMYSIEIVQQSPKDFINWYEDEYNIEFATNQQEKTRLLLCVKEDALLTMTKLFYRNLARNIENGNANLADAYYLMRVFEADLDRHMSNVSVGYLVFFKDFYKNYLEIQNEFFKVLAKDNGLDSQKLFNDFQNYSMNIISGETKYSPYCKLDFLTQEQKEAVISFCDSFYKTGYPTIKQSDEDCTEWLVKAPYENIVFVR